MDPLTDAVFENLVTLISNGDCVLFLGPDLLRSKDGSNCYQSFAGIKCRQMEDSAIAFDATQQDNFYYTTGRYIRQSAELARNRNELQTVSGLSEKRAFVNHLQTSVVADGIYNKLSALPFYLTINTNPDDAFYKAQLKQGGNRQYHFCYYDFNRDTNEQENGQLLPTEITPNHFVTFNVLGHATPERARSLVITESDFLQFNRKVHMPGNGMPVCIRNFIGNDKTCIFLGFNYHLWPLKVLLLSLGFSGDNPKRNISPGAAKLPPFEEDFFRDEMKFLFVDTNPEEFADKLAAKFSEQNAPATRQTQPEKPLQAVFISKAFPATDAEKQDRRIREKISAQLKPLQRQGFLCLWSVDMKLASADGEKELEEKLQSADLYIVLGSDSLADEDISGQLQTACELVKQHPSKRLIPVYSRYYLIDQVNWIDHRTWIPRDENGPVPVIDDGVNEDKRCTQVSTEIRKVIDELLNARDNA